MTSRHSNGEGLAFRTMRLLLFSILVLLAACRGTPDVAPTAGDSALTLPDGNRVIVSFAAYDYELDAYADLARQFHAVQPDVAVQLVSIEEVLGPVPETAGLSDLVQRVVSAADTAHWTPTAADTQRRLLYDLAPFFDTDPSLDAADYYPGMLEAFQWAGGTWAVPEGSLPILMFYDRDVFDAAGLPYPAPGWTWDEFAASAAAVTIREGGEVQRYGCVTRPGLDLLMPYLADHDAPLVDLSADPPTPLLDSPPVAQGLAWYLDLARGQQVMPYFPRGAASAGATALVDEGRAAMWTGFASSYRPESYPGYIGAAPFPSDGMQSSGLRSAPVSGTNPRWMSGWVMSAGTLHPDAAWRWLRFLASQPPVGWMGEMVPARRSLASASALWEGLDDSVAEALTYALEHPFVELPLALTPAYQAFGTATEEVLAGTKDVDRALADAQAAALAGQVTPPATVVVQVAAPATASAAESTGAGKKITFIGGAGDLSAYRALSKEFESAHPGIDVEVRPEPDYADRIGLADLAATGDCFRWGAGVTDDERALVLSLDPFLDAALDFPLDDYYPAFWSACESEGATWCLPFDGALHVIRYDKALLDAAGLAYPALDWTRDDFLATARTLTLGEGTDNQYGFAAVSSEGMTLDQFVAAHAGSLWDLDVTPVRPRFDDPAVVEAVRWYAALAVVHGVKPAVHLYPPWQPPAGDPAALLVHRGRVAMWSELLGMAGGLTGAGREVGTVPFPRGGAPSDPTAIVDAHYISARAAHPLACWQWLEFLAGKIEPVQGIPARRSALESDGFRRLLGADTAAACRAALETGEAVPRGVGQPAWLWRANAWLYEAYDAVLDGADAATALAEAQGKAEAYVACLATSSPDSAASLDCARQVDPAYPAAPGDG